MNRARLAQNDEFYTLLSTIEEELQHYTAHFSDKVVLCNCDDPRVSWFHHFFRQRFTTLGLKKLITTCYRNQNPDIFSRHDCEKAVYLEYNGCKTGRPRHLDKDGDFRNPESITLLQQADIVVTNPPFSLFREFIAQLIQYGKQFLIVGNFNALKYQEIFPLIKSNQVWLGVSPRGMNFIRPDGTLNSVNACWYTNLPHAKRNIDLQLFRKYEPAEFPKYDNYDAINVDKVNYIPKDYAGVMGVPITFMDDYNPQQFEIVGYSRMHRDGSLDDLKNPNWKDSFGDVFLNGKQLYARILIRNKKMKK